MKIKHIQCIPAKALTSLYFPGFAKIHEAYKNTRNVRFSILIKRRISLPFTKCRLSFSYVKESLCRLLPEILVTPTTARKEIEARITTFRSSCRSKQKANIRDSHISYFVRYLLQMQIQIYIHIHAHVLDLYTISYQSHSLRDYKS